jgi:hypothetical protein
VTDIQRILCRAAAATCAFLVLGLLDDGYVLREVVDPSARGRDSDYVQARGFPFDWLVSEELPELQLPLHRRILLGTLAFDMSFLFLFFAGAWLSIALLQTSWKRFRTLRTHQERA